MSEEMSRRKLIRAAATTVVGSSLLAGCVAAGVTPAPPPPGPPPPPPGPPPEAEGAGAYGGGTPGGAPMEKQTKEAAYYQDHPNGAQHCGACANFIPPNDCRVIQGPVSPDGWCRNFRARAPAGY